MTDLRKYGYSPGDYEIHCSQCEQSATADKRAVSCQPCARLLAAEAALATVLANAEVMWRWHEKYPNTRDANAKHWYAEWRASEQQARDIERERDEERKSTHTAMRTLGDIALMFHAAMAQQSGEADLVNSHESGINPMTGGL